MDRMDKMDETEGKDLSKNGTASGARIDRKRYRKPSTAPVAVPIFAGVSSKTEKSGTVPAARGIRAYRAKIMATVLAFSRAFLYYAAATVPFFLGRHVTLKRNAAAPVITVRRREGVHSSGVIFDACAGRLRPRSPRVPQPGRRQPCRLPGCPCPR